MNKAFLSASALATANVLLFIIGGVVVHFMEAPFTKSVLRAQMQRGTLYLSVIDSDIKPFISYNYVDLRPDSSFYKNMICTSGTKEPSK